MSNHKNIAERLKYSRQTAPRRGEELNGFSIDEIGERLGVDKAIIARQEDFSNWQQQDFDDNGLFTEELLKCRELYETSEDWLLFGDPQEKTLADALCVMLVDEMPDQLRTARVITSFLTDYVVTYPFSNIDEAILWLENYRPDLLVCDYEINGENQNDNSEPAGTHVVDTMQSFDGYEEIPIVMLASIEDELLASFRAEITNIEVLQKPYSGNELFEICRSLLNLEVIEREN